VASTRSLLTTKETENFHHPPPPNGSTDNRRAVGSAGGAGTGGMADWCRFPPAAASIRPCGCRDRSRTRARTETLLRLATFPEAPLRSRTVGFPESGSGLGPAHRLSDHGRAHGCRSSSAGSHRSPPRDGSAPGVTPGSEADLVRRRSVAGRNCTACCGPRRSALPRSVE
jgi:hypothetical protein